MNKKIIQIKDDGEALVEVPDDFLYEPMYYKQGLTDDESMKLREGVIGRLMRAKKCLPRGWNFKIWDGYRPLSVQEKLYKGLWELRASENSSWDEARLKEAVERFVAYPSFDFLKPSPHNTGGAVDLTIVDRRGEELDMGTGFDEFREQSYSDYFDGKSSSGSSSGSSEPRADEFVKNRKILKDILVDAGFAPYKWEWWHFAFGNQDWAREYWVREFEEPVAIYGSLEL